MNKLKQFFTVFLTSFIMLTSIATLVGGFYLLFMWTLTSAVYVIVKVFAWIAVLAILIAVYDMLEDEIASYGWIEVRQYE